MQNRQKLERENKNHTSHIALHTSQNGITLIALIITIVLNCSCLAMVVEKKIDKIIGIEKGRNLLYNRLCN